VVVMSETMVSKRIDITLDPKIIKKLDAIKADMGSNMSRSSMIALLITEKYNKNHRGK